MTDNEQLSYDELLTKYKNSEASRLKLREALVLLKERTLNTAELHRQYTNVKDLYDSVVSKLSAAESKLCEEEQKRKAAEGLSRDIQLQLEAAKSTCQETTRHLAASEARAAQLQIELETALMASKEAQHAAEAVVKGKEKADQAVNSLSATVLELQDCLSKQKKEFEAAIDALRAQQQQQDEKYVCLEKELAGTRAFVTKSSFPSHDKVFQHLSTNFAKLHEQQSTVMHRLLSLERSTIHSEMLQQNFEEVAGSLTEQLDTWRSAVRSFVCTLEQRQGGPARLDARTVFSDKPSPLRTDIKRRAGSTGPLDTTVENKRRKYESAHSPQQRTVVEYVERQLWNMARENTRFQPYTVVSVAEKLRSAVQERSCPVECVLTGFENSFADCASWVPKHVTESCQQPTPHCLVIDQQAAAMVQLSIRELPFATAWSGDNPLALTRFTALLLCAIDVDSKLVTSCQFIPLLIQHLHRNFMEGAPDSHMPNELCALSAAAAGLCRARGKLQALRVLLYDIIAQLHNKSAARCAHLLPAVAAALEVWPLAVPLPKPTNPSTSSQHQMAALLPQVMLMAVLKLVFTVLDTNNCRITEAGADWGVNMRIPLPLACVAALRLHSIGEQHWGWPTLWEHTGGGKLKEAQNKLVTACATAFTAHWSGLASKSWDGVKLESVVEDLVQAMVVVIPSFGWALFFEQVVTPHLQPAIMDSSKTEAVRVAAIGLSAAFCQAASFDGFADARLRAVIKSVIGSIIQVLKAGAAAHALRQMAAEVLSSDLADIANQVQPELRVELDGLVEKWRTASRSE